MRLRWLVLVFPLAACGGSAGTTPPDMAVPVEDMAMPPGPDLAGADLSPGPDMAGAPALLVAGARLAAVASDESLLAYYDNATTTNDTVVGDLQLMPLPRGTPTHVDTGAFSAGFTSSTVHGLRYFIHATPSTDSGSTAVYGTMRLLVPSLTAPVSLTSGLAIYNRTAEDGGWELIFDAATPSASASGNVLLYHVADCTGTTCTPIQLAQNVVITGLVPSVDNRFASYAVKKSGTTTTYDITLVDIAAGTTQVVSAGAPNTRQVFSPDGNLFATVDATGQLLVISTSTKQATPWMTVPSTKVNQVAFADSSTLVVRAVDGTGQDDLYLTTANTAGTATVLAMGIDSFELPRTNSNSTGTARYAFYANSLTAGVGDLELLDLTATGTPMPSQLATSASLSSVDLSTDGLYVRYLDSYDTATATGDLTVLSLADMSTTLVSSNVVSGSENFVNDAVFYLDDSLGAGTLNEWKSDGTVSPIATGVDLYRARFQPTSLIYFGTSGDTLWGLASGIYVTVIP